MAKAEAPRIEGVVVQRETTAPPEVNIKNYVDLLWVVGAGVFGFSLLCVTAGIALANPHTSASLQPKNIIQIAIDQVNTAAVLTMEAFPQNLITPTLVLSNTPTSSNLSPTVVASITPTVTASATFAPRTSTQRPRQGGNSNSNSQNIPTLVPTQTSSPLPPTLTSSPNPSPTITNTPRPTRTRTPIPSPTNTPRPTRTRTPIPSPT